MKVAVTSQGQTLDSELDPRFGRARYFIVVDTETEDFEVIENIQNLNAVQGAGIQSTQAVINQQVKAVLTGHCGPKAFQVMAKAGIKIYPGLEGTVRAAVSQLKAGKCEEAAGPDVKSHW
ncbi:MAG: NifB/NifX family molybdenum-iron cluster-binding protein [bacterium]